MGKSAADLLTEIDKVSPGAVVEESPTKEVTPVEFSEDDEEAGQLFDDDEEQEEGDDDDTDTPTIPAPKTQAGDLVSLPSEAVVRPFVTPPQTIKPVPTPDPEDEAPVEEPKKKTTRGTRKATATKGELQKYIQSADRVRIYKRSRSSPLDPGHLSYINDYSAKELRECGAVDVFIKQFISPHYGYGDFAVELVKADGTQLPAGMVSIAAPNVPQPPEAKENSLETLFDRVAKFVSDSDKKAEELLEKRRKEWMDMAGMINSTGKPVDQSALMLMMMQIQQQRPSTDSASALVEALKETIKQERLNKVRSMEHHEPLTPFTLPASLPEPASTATDMARAMGELAKTMKGDSITIKDILPLIESKKSDFTWEKGFAMFTQALPLVKQALGVEEMSRRLDEQGRRHEELMRQIAEGQNNSRMGLSDVMREASELRRFMHEFGGGRDIDNFWSTVNKTVNEGIPKIIDSIKTMKAQKEEQKKLTSGEQKQETKELTIPDSSIAELKKLENVTDEPEIIGGYLALIQELMKIPEWKVAMEGGMKAIYQGDKESSMIFARSVLEGLRDGGHISSALFDRSIRAFDNNFEELSKSLRNR